MACMANTLSLIKDEDFDQLVGWIERKWNKMFSIHFPTAPRFTAATPPLLLALQVQTALQQKKIIKDDLQYIQTMQGTQFPKD
jgi:hypothetical protein